MANAETNLKNEILLALGCLPDVYIQNQPTGRFRGYDNPDRVVKIGTPGQADLAAVVAVTITPDMVGQTVGLAWYPEVKTAKGTQRETQELWQLAVEKRGARYDLVRSPAQALEILAAIRRGELRRAY